MVFKDSKVIKEKEDLLDYLVVMAYQAKKVKMVIKG
jgi:hypothetical protein